MDRRRVRRRGGLFAVTYLLVGIPVADPTHRAAIAFAVTCLGGWSLSWAIRRDR
ncbi:hypothetical protein [Natrinema saccharevitans]|uniref:hypothetical protein n=1 Tax=Natrinema saccharevitans TaxID=301967 RepID=UPI001FE382DE|nr:hypothetical protein [Natrinema saccharevitans]